MTNKPKYDILGERIDEHSYYSKKQQKEFDFYQFFKVIGIASGVILLASLIFQIIIK
jgi:hypothetical protein